MPPKITGGQEITGDTDLGANAIGFGERSGFRNDFPAPRPVSQIESEGLQVPAQNEYVDLIPKTDSNEYGQLLDQAKDGQKSAVKQAMFAAESTDPDRQAKILDLSNKLRIPSSIVERQYETLSKKDRLHESDYDKILENTPGLAAWLQNPENAALGKDDLENLGKVDQATSFFSKAKAFPEELRQSAQAGTSGLASSALLLGGVFGFTKLDPEAIANWNKQTQDLEEKAPDYVKQFNQILSEKGGDLKAAWNQFTNGFQEVHDQGILQALKDVGSGGIKTVGDALSLISSFPENPRATANALAGMTPYAIAALPGASVGGAAGLATGPLAPYLAPAGAIAGSFINNSVLMTGMKLNELLSKSGIDVTDPEDLARAFSNPQVMAHLKNEALQYGVTAGAVQAVFQGFAGKFLGAASKEAGTAEKVARGAADIGVQSAGMTASDIAGQAAENKKEGIDLGSSITMGALSLAHAVGTEVTGLSIRSKLNPDTVTAAKEVAAQAQEATQVHSDLQALTELGQAVKSSKVSERSPEKMSELIQHSGADSNVYFQTEDWDRHWTAKGISPVEAAQAVLGDAAPYHEAKATGSSLEIPVADFAAKVGPTQSYEELLPFVRSKPDGMNLKESDEFLKSVPATVEELSREANLSPLEKSAQAVKTNIKQQLIDAGTLPADAEKIAQVHESVFKSLGEKTNQDPMALFERYKLKINKPDLNTLKAEEQTILNQESPLESQYRTQLKKTGEKDYATRPETMGGKYINQDFIREMLKEYAASPEGRSVHVETTQKASADYTQKFYEDRLKAPVLGDASIIIGGPGSGKTTAGQMILSRMAKSSDVILDNVGANLKQLTKNIELALESGRPVHLIYVHAPFEKALSHIETRFNETGRPVPPEVAARGHVLSLENYLALKEKYKNNPDVEINAVEQTGEMPKLNPELRSVEEIKKLRYIQNGETSDQAIQRLTETAKERLQKVSEEVQARRLKAGSQGLEGQASAGEISTLKQSSLQSEFQEVKASEYIKARDRSSRSQFLTPYTAKELKNYRLFLNKEGVGYALSPEGDMVGVFNNSSIPGAGREAIVHGISNGAKTLDAIDGFLPKYYNQFGFVEEKRLPWDDKYAPKGWNYGKYGRPDIVFLRYEDTVSRDPNEVRQRAEIARSQLAGSPDQTRQSDVFPERNGRIDWKIWGRLDPAAQSAALRRAGAYSESVKFQEGGPNEPRGQIRFSNNKEFNIDLLKNADMSTALHELGHFYLELLSDISKSDQATDQIKKDLGTIHEWLGVKQGDNLSPEQHEQFARGFEAYLMEGKAPSIALKKAFEAFKVWLTNVYRSIKNLRVDLTPEVRQVFDRLLASEEEIKAAETTQNMNPLFPDPVKAGMSEAQADRYIKARDEARSAAEAELSNKLLEDIRKKQTAAYKAKRAKVEEEVTKQVDSTNLYKAIKNLKEIEDLKLAKSEVDPEMRSKLPKGIFAKEGGLSPDVAAELLNFQSGDDLLIQLANAPDRKEAIQIATEQKMQDESPDLLTSDGLQKAAMAAVHNTSQAKLLRMELEHLASNNLPALKDVIRKVTRRVPTEMAVREQAENMISEKNVLDVKSYLFERAERKAAKEAGDLLAKGDIDGAFQAKQKELLNHELWKAANAAEEDIQKSVKRFRKLSQSDEDLSKTRDTDLISAARALLSKFGIGNFADDSPENYLKAMKTYDEEAYHTVKDLIDSLSQNIKPVGEMTYGEFLKLKEAVNALWSLSKSQKQLLIDGEKIDRNRAIQDLSVRLSELSAPKEKKQYDKAATKWEKTKAALHDMLSSLQRIEQWVDSMDGGKITGSFRKYIATPVQEGIGKYRLQNDQYLKKFTEIIKPMRAEFGEKAIRAPELVNGRGEIKEFNGKRELLGALLHTGNDSNFDKLLRGNGWEKAKWDAFIKRMIAEKVLTKADYDLLQKTWDLFKEIKPEAQKAHKDLYGFYFNEITNREFDTPFGRYEGGYVPAIADPMKAPDAQIRAEKDLLEKFNNSWMFPTTGRGFTKARVDSYAAPLVMDLGLVPSQIDKVLRFIHIEPRVKDVSKLVMNREFRKMLDAHDPSIAGDMIVPWLQRSAQQRMTTPSQGRAGRAIDTFFKEIRSRTGLATLIGSVANILHQYTGFSTSAVLVKPSNLRGALWDYMRSPTKLAEEITEKSDFLKARSGHQTFGLVKEMQSILDSPSKYQIAKDFAIQHGLIFQQMIQNQADMVSWLGAYRQAVKEGLSEKEAVRFGDSVIRRTQHLFNPEDVSRFETGPAWLRAFTQFYGYYNMRANLLGGEFQRTIRDQGLKAGAGRLLYVYTFGLLVPALMHEAIVHGLSGKNLEEEDADQYMNDFLSIFFGGQVRDLTAMIPIVGPTVQASINRFNNKWYDDRINTSPAVSALESAAGAPYSIYKAFEEEGSRKRAIQDALTLLSLVSGFPVAPLSRPLGYLSDVQEGRAEPSGPIDFTRGLITGKSGK